MKRLAIHQFDIAANGKRQRLVSEHARRHHKPTGSTRCCHHSIKLAHRRHTDLERLPLFALYQERLARSFQHQIDPTIGATASGLGHVVALAPESLAHQRLELLPAHIVECAPVGITSHLRMQRLAPGAPKRRHGCTEQECKRQQILAKLSQRLDKCLGCKVAQLSGLGDRRHFGRGNAMQPEICRYRKPDTSPPRELASYFYQAFNRASSVASHYFFLSVASSSLFSTLFISFN